MCVVCCALGVMYIVWCYMVCVCVLCVVSGVRLCAVLCGGFRFEGKDNGGTKRCKNTRFGTFNACAE